MLTRGQRVLHAIHGYPPRFNAGSEVYTRLIANQMAKVGCETHVFTRELNPFRADYAMRETHDGPVTVHLMNHAREKVRYQNTAIDDAFRSVVRSVQPSILHIGHLNHLSVGIVNVAKSEGVPIVMTLHDYWLQCPRGQFLKNGLRHTDLPELCSGQDDAKCAAQCFNRMHGEMASDVEYWNSWIGLRMDRVREAVAAIDHFLVPSRTILNRFRSDLGVGKDRSTYLDYGFDHSSLSSRVRQQENRFVFGYIGRHHESKGIDLLIRAFAALIDEMSASSVADESAPLLRIWGRPDFHLSDALYALVQELGIAGNVEWHTEYDNDQIVSDVFNRCDVVVVPSVWDENSPLVLHEAQQARVPTITAAHGGMGEYVVHGENGLTFEHRNVQSLHASMRQACRDPAALATLGKRGYLFSADGNVPSIGEHVNSLLTLYDKVSQSMQAEVAQDQVQRKGKFGDDGPWRITFDTNPDLCNLSCTMCEEHSPHSPIRQARTPKTPKRRMDVNLIRKVVAESVPNGLREVIPTTMGEPLLWDGFPEMLAICREFGVKLNLTTNGTFPKRGATKWAKEIVPITSDVKISWNGASKSTQERVMIGSRYDRQVKRLLQFLAVRDERKRLGEHACSVTLQVTFMEVNHAEFPELIRWAASIGIDRVKGHHLWAHFPQIADEDMRRSHDSVNRWNAVARACREAASGTSLRLENFGDVSKPLARSTADTQEDVSGDCPFLGKEAWVNWEGRFDPCCAPNEQRKQLGSFGNLHKTNLSTIWNSKGYQRLRANYKQFDLCKRCNMRKYTTSTRAHAAPVDSRRFESLLAFHDPPGLAAASVRRDAPDQSFHVDREGNPAYSARFARTFGFYDMRAAVIVKERPGDEYWFHIEPSGERVYAQNWQWCGNFQQERAVVRDFDGQYHHINLDGQCLPAVAAYAYAGDFRENCAVVRLADTGMCKHINTEGEFFYDSEFIELDVFHKGVARARDENGWLFIDENGNEFLTGQERFAGVENFYNGQALVTLLDGSFAVLKEDGLVACTMPESVAQSRACAQSDIVAYWRSFALRIGLLLYDHADNYGESPYSYWLKQCDEATCAALGDAWIELGYMTAQRELTARGERLVCDEEMRKRAVYFLTTQLDPWLEFSVPSHFGEQLDGTGASFFEKMSDEDSKKMHEVLSSYAKEDWKGLPTLLVSVLGKYTDLLPVIADVGGGYGVLAKDLKECFIDSRVVLVDLPRVIEDLAERGGVEGVELCGQDMFESVPQADLFVLARVLHDWNDEQCTTLLRNLRRARNPNALLVVVDRSSDVRDCKGELFNAMRVQGLMSLNMHLINGGKERSTQEMNTLLEECGWIVRERAVHYGHSVYVCQVNN